MLVPIKETSETIKGLVSTFSIKVSDALSELKAVKDKAFQEVSIQVYNLINLI